LQQHRALERIQEILAPFRSPGASEIARRSVSTPVFFGMLAASTVGIFLIHMPYVVFQSLREKTQSKTKAAPAPHMQPAECPRLDFENRSAHSQQRAATAERAESNECARYIKHGLNDVSPPAL